MGSDVGSLEGRVAIVTGAGRGIGRAEALHLARAGAAVVVNDMGGEWDGEGRDERPAQAVVDAIVEEGGRAVASYEDVADWEAGERLVRGAIEEFGRLDILVCNAGILRDRMLFKMSEDEWDAVVRVHLRGHFVPSRFACEHWRSEAKRTGGGADGRLIFTSSESGLYGNPGQGNYVAAKAGIAGLGLMLAREMERYGVTVNTICPRARTRLNESTFGEFAVDDEVDLWSPDNVAPLVAYLAGPDARSISGQLFTVGAGIVELVEGWKPVARAERPDRLWTVAELSEGISALFGDRDSKPPPFGFEMPVAETP